jgi:hypothetical protein
VARTRVCVSCWVVRSKTQRPRRERERKVKRVRARVVGEVVTRRDRIGKEMGREGKGDEVEGLGERAQRARTTGI